ncbi:MAG: isoprenylcysteine carboxylmethyltransferase family protein [Candidatus Cybelea sp.]
MRPTLKNRHLKRHALINVIVSVPLIWLIIFFPAGTFDYWQAWVFIAIMGVCGSLTSAYFWRKDRSLLERRMRLAETDPAQKLIVALLYSLIVTILVMAARDHRMHWSSEIPLLVVLGDVLLVAGSYVYFLVFRENSFAGATIRVSADQRVISTGPYAIVRHPLYVGLLIMVMGMPLSLGSYWALLLVLPLLPLIVWRLENEEAFLAESLPGYRQYQQAVRWRLIPGVF